MTYVGPRYDDDANTVKLDPYTRIDLSADYRVNSNRPSTAGSKTC